MTKRAAADENGGIVSTVKRIARYVEPQMRYTAASAVQIASGEAAGRAGTAAPDVTERLFSELNCD